MSLRIIINNKEVALPDEVEIVIKLKNTMFDERGEDATYPLTLPVNANRNIFDFLDRMYTGNLEEEFPATVYFGPYKLLEGRCVMTDVTEGNVELFIATDKNTFFGRAQDVYLDGLDLGEERYSSKSAMLDAFTDSAQKGDKDYVICPLSDPYLPNIGVNQTYDFYNCFYPDANTNPNTKYTEQINDKYCIFTPFIRLYKLLEKVVKALGYELTSNDLLLDDDFKDVILMCRRNGMYKDSLGCSISYNMHVPHLLVADFVTEIEHKFGVVFIVNENNHSVEIRGWNNDVIDVEIFDDMSKHLVEKDDRIKGIIIKDKSIADKRIEEYTSKLNIEYGDTTDAETIECISTVVGVEWTDIDFRPDDYTGEVTYWYIRNVAINMEYGSTTEYMNQIESEFRLSVYRGYIAEEIYQSGQNYFCPIKYPYATPVPVSYADNKYSLLWKEGLFNKYHKDSYDLRFSIKENHEFYLKPDILQLGKLQQIFAKRLMIRNRLYRCFEQEITFSKKSIVSHIVRCYPL
nr:hypothetical protein [uncultured Butyricimonas sp.]DAZ13380.1 MAG TPA: hypothetical protein [Caudoviricetes sp.]